MERIGRNLFLEPENADAWLCMALRNHSYNRSFYANLQKGLQLEDGTGAEALAKILFPTIDFGRWDVGIEANILY